MHWPTYSLIYIEILRIGGFCFKNPSVLKFLILVLYLLSSNIYRYQFSIIQARFDGTLFFPHTLRIFSVFPLNSTQKDFHVHPL